ncbi:hypothetical protein [Kineococcus sp. SYSU DK001]|uniref:hypothetical protein n=1 Tax=Kineococcus sp. SYSU DK001 TaxID=3383122 RepID=UPI003D7EF0F2
MPDPAPRPSRPPAAPVPPGVPVLRRRDGLVQVGSSPRSARLHRSDELPRDSGTGGPGGPEVSDEVRAWSAYDREGAGPRDRSRRRTRSAVAVAGPAATAGAVVAVLADAGVGRLLSDRPLPGTTTGSQHPADLLVLVHDHVADPVVADGVLADGVPHLSVVLRDTDAVVGPLVLPGRSACLRCLDRWRTDADPAWPEQRSALLRAAPRPPDAATTRVVAGLAGLQVLSHLDGLTASTVGASLEVLLPEGRVRQRWWRPHPACGCLDLPVP